MACFTAPVAQALVVGALKTSTKKSENPFLARLGLLQKMLFGGSFLLAIEHVYHGEVIFTWPFLTAVRDGNTAEVLREIATVGSAMTVLIVAVWIGMLIVSSLIVKRCKTVEAEG